MACDDFCYRYSDYDFNWFRARSVCHEDDANLVLPDTIDMDELLKCIHVSEDIDSESSHEEDKLVFWTAESDISFSWTDGKSLQGRTCLKIIG